MSWIRWSKTGHSTQCGTKSKRTSGISSGLPCSSCAITRSPSHRLAASRQKAGSDAANAITAFIATSDYLDENTTAAINNTLNQRLRDTAAIDRSAAE
jgi:hypothetical protein